MVVNKADVNSRLIVWVVGALAGLQAFFEALSEALRSDLAQFSLWSVATVCLFGIAVMLERLKVVRRQ